MLKRILSLILTVGLLIPSLISCDDTREFSHSELVISLPSGFYKEDSSEYDLVLTDGESSVGIMRISLSAAFESGIPDTLSPLDFAEYMLKKSGIDGAVYSYGDVPYYTVTVNGGGGEYYSLYTFYRSKYAYFAIVFSCPKRLEDEWREKFFSYADTVAFTA